MSTGAKYIADLASRGRYHFTTPEAQAALGGSLPAVVAKSRRLLVCGEVRVNSLLAMTSRRRQLWRRTHRGANARVLDGGDGIRARRLRR
jgi:hypothetical protein